MQLLVFAHTPPPVHGQSLMVRTLVQGLAAAAPGLKIFHVNPQLSRDASDVGSWRPSKIFVLLAACWRALGLRLRHGSMDFYYVPAPGRRAPLYRDWLVMAFCRLAFRRLILHWHGIGLGHWLAHRATPPERWLTQWLLGRADLALVLAPELAADAEALRPRKLVIVPNGVADPGPIAERNHVSNAPTQILFLGLCTPAKGLFDTLTAVAVANRRESGAFRLLVAGGFTNRRDEEAFFSQADALGPGVVRHVGFADEIEKHTFFADADVFCFPTTHPHEGQPLALIEALAHDMPIITTRWRAIPGMLPDNQVWFVNAGRPDQIAHALITARRAGPRRGERRAHYLAHFTREKHLATLAKALSEVDVSDYPA